LGFNVSSYPFLIGAFVSLETGVLDPRLKTSGFPNVRSGEIKRHGKGREDFLHSTGHTWEETK
jgi:hypothetical protein